jgi:hypothetical protein
MPRVITILLTSISTWFRSRLAMQMELIALRHQVAVYKQRISRPKLQPPDRGLCGVVRPRGQRYNAVWMFY